MSSRGAKIENGHVTTDEYCSEQQVYDAKVLKGSNNKYHGLPDYAHSPNRIYIKENHDGTFREMRIYDDRGFPKIEIGYHPEPQISGNRHDKILHYHTFDSDLKRYLEGKLKDAPELYEKYKKYLEVYGL
jgi:hypothetical protein